MVSFLESDLSSSSNLATSITIELKTEVHRLMLQSEWLESRIALLKSDQSSSRNVGTLIGENAKIRSEIHALRERLNEKSHLNKIQIKINKDMAVKYQGASEIWKLLDQDIENLEDWLDNVFRSWVKSKYRKTRNESQAVMVDAGVGTSRAGGFGVTMTSEDSAVVGTIVGTSVVSAEVVLVVTTGVGETTVGYEEGDEDEEESNGEEDEEEMSLMIVSLNQVMVMTEIMMVAMMVELVVVVERVNKLLHMMTHQGMTPLVTRQRK